MINPIALTLWLILGILGYLFTDTIRGALIWLVIGMVFSFVCSFISLLRKYF